MDTWLSEYKVIQTESHKKGYIELLIMMFTKKRAYKWPKPLSVSQQPIEEAIQTEPPLVDEGIQVRHSPYNKIC